MQTDVWNILDSCAFFSQIHPDGKIATVSNIENEMINRQSKQYFSNLKHNIDYEHKNYCKIFNFVFFNIYIASSSFRRTKVIYTQRHDGPW